MTTEGDGNYQLQRFLESEGAESDIQLVDRVAPLHASGKSRDDTQRARATSASADTGEVRPRRRRRVRRRQEARDRCAPATSACASLFQTFAHAAGLYGYNLPDMDDDRRGQRTTTTTTISAAAKATWKSAS